jgi:predicted AlkP superfamily pyrophosphatase or phosphodiesterase
MRCINKTSLLIAGAVCWLSGCQAVKVDRLPADIDHVIVIGVDGMSPDGLRKAATPVMDNLIAQGAVKWTVRTVLPTYSSPNWASMIMGAGPEQHGIANNGWEKNKHTLPPVIAGGEGIFPSIFLILRQQRPAAEIGAVYHWSGFGRLLEKKALDYDQDFPTEDLATAGFIQYIETKKPTFAFLQLDHVDRAGHEVGHGTPSYYQAVEKTDLLIGRILQGIKAAGMEQTTLVIVTADHGGRGKGHGKPTPEEAEIAMILYGKDIKKGYEIQQPVYTYDLAATLAFAFHLTPPYAWIGRPIKPAFEGFAEPANLWTGK